MLWDQPESHYLGSPYTHVSSDSYIKSLIPVVNHFLVEAELDTPGLVLMLKNKETQSIYTDRLSTLFSLAVLFGRHTTALDS